MTAAQVVRVLKDYHERSQGERVVNKARAALHAAYNHAVRADHDVRRPLTAARFKVEANPVAAVPIVREWNRARSGTVERSALRAFYDAMAARKDVTGRFWCLLTLTGQRMQQLLAAKYDDKRGTLTVLDPKGRGGAATPRENVVPVTPRMRALLKEGALLVNFNTAQRIASETAGGTWMLSDIRRTMETRLQELGVTREHRGALLSHGQGGVQQRHYETSELLKIKRATLLAWERWLFAKARGRPG